MKILVLSDLHAHNYKAHSVIAENGHNSRLLNIGNALYQAIQIGIQNNCEACLIAGDVFHVRGHIKPQIYNYIFKIVEDISCHFSTYMVSGNHDQEARSGTSALEPFNSIPNCYLIDNADESIGNLWVHGIPYIHDVDEFKQQFVENANADIILMHQGIDDFRPTASIPETTITASYLESINSGFIVSGHYHKKGLCNKVLSPGCPIQHHFGDEGDDKGCWIIDTDTASMVFYKLDYPEFVTISVDELDQDFTDKVVRIKLSGDDNIEEIKNKIGDCLDLQVEVTKQYSSVHDKTVTIGDPYDMLSDYIDCVEDYKAIKTQLMKHYVKVCV